MLYADTRPFARSTVKRLIPIVIVFCRKAHLSDNKKGQLGKGTSANWPGNLEGGGEPPLASCDQERLAAVYHTVNYYFVNRSSGGLFPPCTVRSLFWSLFRCSSYKITREETCAK